MSIATLISKAIGDKKRWRQYKARVQELPAPHRSAAEAIEKVLMYFVPHDGDSAAAMFEDLAELFEQAAADRVPIEQVVGDDPMAFIESFASNYTSGGWVPPGKRRSLARELQH